MVTCPCWYTGTVNLDLMVRYDREKDEEAGQSFGDGAWAVSGHDLRPSNTEVVSITELCQFNGGWGGGSGIGQ